MTIRELRKANSLTQAQLADLLGISKGTVGHLENGRMQVSDRIADKIWEVFGVEIREPEEKKPVKKAAAPKLEIYIQSPLGGNITPEEVAARMPEGRENGDTGYIWIWD